MAKLGDHVSLYPFECDQAGRQVYRQADKNSSLGDFLRIQYLAFGYCFVVFNTIFGFVSAKTIP